MNERVKQLAEFHTLNINVMQAIYEDITRLIVEDCAKISESVTPRHTECGNRIAAKIRQFNGVDCVDSTLRNRSTYFGNNP